MAVEWWHWGRPWFGRDVLVSKVGLKRGRKTEFPIDPRDRRADPRRMGHGAKRGLRAAGCKESEVLMVPCVVREDWMQHGRSWHGGQNTPWSKAWRMEDFNSGDRKSRLSRGGKLCGQKPGNLNGTLASEHQRRKPCLERSVADSHRKVVPHAMVQRPNVSQRRHGSKLGWTWKRWRGGAITA